MNSVLNRQVLLCENARGRLPEPYPVRGFSRWGVPCLGLCWGIGWGGVEMGRGYPVLILAGGMGQGYPVLDLTGGQGGYPALVLAKGDLVGQGGGTMSWSYSGGMGGVGWG